MRDLRVNTTKRLIEGFIIKWIFSGEKENLCFTVQNGDLFQVHENVSLAHCVSADMEMSKGIAVEFKNRFSRVDELLSHRKSCYLAILNYLIVLLYN